MHRNHMTKRYRVEETGRIPDPYQVRDTQTNTILRSYPTLSDAQIAAWQRNTHLRPTWRMKLKRWFTGTPVDEHTRRRQRIAERCELGQRRISQKG